MGAEIGDLPEGWVTATVSEVCEINPSKPRTDQYPPDLPVTFVPMPAVNAVQGAITNPSIRAFADVRKGFTAFRENDVILAKITPCMENGKAAVARGLLNGLGFGSTEFHVMRSSGAMLPDFIYHFIRQESFRKLAEQEMTGSVGQKRVPAEYLQNVAIPLPPLHEQKRIVAKVEEALGRVTAARERLAKVPAILKRFRQAVLAAACSGRLTEGWRERHSNEWHTSAAKPRLHENTPPGGFAEELPSTWLHGSVSGVSSEIVDCPHSTPKWTIEGEVCLRTTNFRVGRLDLSERRYVSRQTYQERIGRLQPMPGDVVYSREGGILGIACVIPKGLQTCLGQRMMLMRTHVWFMPAFLMHVLNSPATNKIVEALTGGTASPHLNVGDVKDFPVPVPPTSEQNEIIRRVDALFKLADVIEQRLSAASRQVDKLTQAVLAKAFRGELVPTEAELARTEGRDYEPASVLLDRVRAERAASTSPKPSRRRKT